MLGRARRDADLRLQIQRVFDAKLQVQRVRKIWRQLRCEGFDVARFTVPRLMSFGIEGGYQRQAAEDDDPGQEVAVPVGRCEPPV